MLPAFTTRQYATATGPHRRIPDELREALARRRDLLDHPMPRSLTFHFHKPVTSYSDAQGEGAALPRSPRLMPPPRERCALMFRHGSRNYRERNAGYSSLS